MTISERIFKRLQERGMSQKEFSDRTGIAQSSISDWKRKKTNPVSEKILIICDVLDVTPYELLGATEGEGKRSNPSEVIVVEKGSETGRMLEEYLGMSEKYQERLLGYMHALQEMPDYGEGSKKKREEKSSLSDAD